LLARRKRCQRALQGGGIVAPQHLHFHHVRARDVQRGAQRLMSQGTTTPPKVGGHVARQREQPRGERAARALKSWENVKCTQKYCLRQVGGISLMRCPGAQVPVHTIAIAPVQRLEGGAIEQRHLDDRLVVPGVVSPIRRCYREFARADRNRAPRRPDSRVIVCEATSVGEGTA
jgi:hypothetical protein